MCHCAPPVRNRKASIHTSIGGGKKSSACASPRWRRIAPKRLQADGLRGPPFHPEPFSMASKGPVSGSPFPRTQRHCHLSRTRWEHVLQSQLRHLGIRFACTTVKMHRQCSVVDQNFRFVRRRNDARGSNMIEFLLRSFVHRYTFGFGDV